MVKTASYNKLIINLHKYAKCDSDDHLMIYVVFLSILISRDFALKPQMALPHHFMISSASLCLRWWEALQASSTEDREPNVDFTSVDVQNGYMKGWVDEIWWEYMRVMIFGSQCQITSDSIFIHV